MKKNGMYIDSIFLNVLLAASFVLLSKARLLLYSWGILQDARMGYGTNVAFISYTYICYMITVFEILLCLLLNVRSFQKKKQCEINIKNYTVISLTSFIITSAIAIILPFDVLSGVFI